MKSVLSKLSLMTLIVSLLQEFMFPSGFLFDSHSSRTDVLFLALENLVLFSPEVPFILELLCL